MLQTKTSERTKLTITLPKSKWLKIRRLVPKGDYSKFFELSAERELGHIAQKKLLALRGKIEFDMDWDEMEAIEMKFETK